MRAVVIEITGDPAKLTKAVGQVDKDLDRLGKSAEQAGGRMEKGIALPNAAQLRSAAIAIGGGMAVAGAAINDLSNSANFLNQQVDTSRRVFGDWEAVVRAAGVTAADTLGMSEAEFRKAANQMGAMLEGLGFGQQEAARYAVSLQRVGADLGAAFSEDPARAVEAIGAALRGERDSIEAFGVSIKEADVAAKTTALGLDTSTSSAKKHADAIATLAIIQERAEPFAGAYAKASEEGANASVRAAKKFEDAKARLGNSLRPIQTQVMEWGSQIADAFTGMSAAAEGLGATVESNLKTKSWEEGAEYVGLVRTQIDGLKTDLENSSAMWDGAYRDSLRNAIKEMENGLDKGEKYRKGLADRAAAEGITIEALKKREEAQAAANKGTGDAVGPTKDATKAVGSYAEAIDRARSAMSKWLDDHRSNLDTALDSKDAWARWQETLGKNGLQFDYVNGKINDNTEAGRENLRTLSSLVDALVAEDVARAKTDGIDAGRAALENHRRELINSMVAAGMTRQAAETLTDKLGLIPKSIEVQWREAGFTQVMSDLATYTSALLAAQAINPLAGGWYRPSTGAARAGGGPAGGLTLVGERGPELAMLPGGSHVYSHTESVRMMQSPTLAMGGSGPLTVQVLIDGDEVKSAVITHLAREQGAW